MPTGTVSAKQESAPKAQVWTPEPELVARFEPENVFEPSPEILILRHRAAMSRALQSTTAMRAAAEAFLPRFPMEHVQDYQLRLSRSFLLEDYAESLLDHANRAIHEGLLPDEDTPPDILEWYKDFDGRGLPLDDWAACALWIGLRDGGIWAWVDQPKVPEGTSEGQAREAGIRPTARMVDIDGMIGWIPEDDDSGAANVTQVRIASVRSRRVGRFGRVLAEGVWVLDSTDRVAQLWERPDPDAAPEVIEETKLETDGIPVFHFSAGPAEGIWMHEPPFLAHAWKNVEHWQSASEQRHGLAYARRWLYHFQGFTEEEFNEMVSIGSNVKIRSDSPNAAINIAAPPTAGLDAGFQDLANLMSDMRRLGRRPLIDQRSGGDVTATEVRLQDARSSPSLVTLAGRFESFINQVIRAMARLRNVEDRLPEKPITLPKEQLVVSGISDLEVLDRLGVERQVILEEAQRRDILDDKWRLEDVWQNRQTTAAAQVVAALTSESEEDQDV